MKRTFVLGILACLSGALSMAQSPTWAEQLHKTKTGVWPAGVEERLKREKQAREQAQDQARVLEAISKTDTNQDGVLSPQERENAAKPAEKPQTK